MDGTRDGCGNDAARLRTSDVDLSARTSHAHGVFPQVSAGPLVSGSGAGVYAGTLTAAMAAAARGDLDAVELLVSMIPGSQLRSAIAALITSYVGALLMHSPGAGEAMAEDMARLIAGWECG